MSLVEARIAEWRRWIVAERGYLANATNEENASWHEQEIAGLEGAILRYQHYDLIARLCVRKGLPAGDPAWMAKLICSFIVPPIEEDDHDDDFLACGCCRR
jgi:hypothetical protein